MRSTVWLFGCAVLAVVPLSQRLRAQDSVDAFPDEVYRKYVEQASKPIEVPALEVGEETYAAQLLEKSPELLEQVEELPKFEMLKSGLPQIEIDGTTFWIAEGDLLLDEDELALHASARAAQEQLFNTHRLVGQIVPEGVDSAQTELVAIVRDGKLVRWSPGLTLRYCVLRNTFPNESTYRTVRDNMIAATAQWEEVCGCDFEYVASLDNSTGTQIPGGAVFCVRHIDAQGKFIASAFFPMDPQPRRKILIDPSYFTTNFDRIGVLRHEIGHVLGFRHEHIRSEAPGVCPNENTGFTFNLSNYDARSVMHYYCGGAGTPTLSFSNTDIQSARKLYGPPLASLQFVEVN